MRGHGGRALALAMVAGAAPIVVAAACGGTAHPRPALANRPPDGGAVAAVTPDAGAGADDVDADAGDECTTGTPQTLRVAGRDHEAALVACVTGHDHEGPDVLVTISSVRLVLDPGTDGEVSTDVGTIESGGEEGASIDVIGALSARSGEQAIVLRTGSFGPAEGLNGVAGAVLVYAVRGGAWEKVYATDGQIADGTLSKDGRTLTVGTCDLPARGEGKGTRGGGCDSGNAYYDGDGRSFELTWDGQQIDARETTAKP